MASTSSNIYSEEFMNKDAGFYSNPHHFNTFAMTESRLALVVVGVVFTLIGSLAIAARITNLLLRRRKAWYDDWAMLVAYFFSIGFTIASYVSIRWGVGLELKDVPPFWSTKAIQAVYAIEIFYYFSLFFVKLSILFLYLRLARELRNHFYKWTLVLIGVLVVHFLTTIIVFCVQCVPIKKYWAPSTPGHCISITGFFYSTNVFTIVTDLCMLALPIPTVWKVPYSLTHKIGIIAAFLCGGLTTVASCARLYSIRVYTESPQPLLDAAPINTWSFIEINVGICCASVAVIRQFVAVSRHTSTNSSKQYSSIGSRAPMQKRTDISSTGIGFSPGTYSYSKNTPIPNSSNIARWPPPSPSKNGDGQDLEEGLVDIDGTTIRQSMTLPPSPVYIRSSGGDTALPQKQPMLQAFVMGEHEGGSLTKINIVPKSASPPRQSWI